MFQYFKCLPIEIKLIILQELFCDKSTLMTLRSLDGDVSKYLNNHYVILNMIHPQSFDSFKRTASHDPNFKPYITDQTADLPRSWSYKVHLTEFYLSCCRPDNNVLRPREFIEKCRDMLLDWLNTLEKEDCKILEIRIYTSPFLETCLQCDLDCLLGPHNILRVTDIPIHITIVKSDIYSSLAGYKKINGHGRGEDLKYEGLFDKVNEITIMHDRWSKELVIDSYESLTTNDSDFEAPRHIFLKSSNNLKARTPINIGKLMNLKSIEILSHPGLTAYEQKISTSKSILNKSHLKVKGSLKLQKQGYSGVVPVLSGKTSELKYFNGKCEALSRALTTSVQSNWKVLKYFQDISPKQRPQPVYSRRFLHQIFESVDYVTISSFRNRRRLSIIQKLSDHMDKSIWKRIVRAIFHLKKINDYEIRIVRFKVFHCQEILTSR